MRHLLKCFHDPLPLYTCTQLVLVDGCEEIVPNVMPAPGESESLSSKLQKLLTMMVKEVAIMKIVVTSRVDLGYKGRVRGRLTASSRDVIMGRCPHAVSWQEDGHGGIGKMLLPQWLLWHGCAATITLGSCEWGT